jgi:hypothetical protein
MQSVFEVMYSDLRAHMRNWDQIQLGGRLGDAHDAIFRRAPQEGVGRALESVRDLYRRYGTLLNDYHNLEINHRDLFRDRNHILQKFEKADEQRVLEVSALEAKMKAREDEFSFNFQSLRSDHTSERDQMIRDHTKEVRTLTNTAEAARQQAENDHQDEVDHLNTNHSALVERLQNLHSEELEAHRKQREESERRLRADMESLASALVERDGFKPINDSKVKSKFSDVEAQIENLSRVKWTLQHTLWSSALLTKMSPKNVQRLQKEILVNVTWTILFEQIFCSPFRIFGEKGKELEDQWYEEYGDEEDQGMLPSLFHLH